MSQTHALTVGVFDGVHLGHRAVLGALLEQARVRAARATVVTFDPHPLATLAPDRCPALLTPIDERVELLRALGVDDVRVERFDAALAALSPADFLARLSATMRLRALVVGPDHAFGHHREGTPEMLAALGLEQGFTVHAVAPVTIDGAPAGSTRIRRALESGALAEVEAVLGRRYTLRGVVGHGDARGRTLGFPTANITCPREKVLPCDGVYAVRVARRALNGAAPIAGAMNVGMRPTFGGTTRTVEVFLLDFAADVVGEELDVEIVARLRDEERFASKDALIAQMTRDVAETRRVLREHVPQTR